MSKRILRIAKETGEEAPCREKIAGDTGDEPVHKPHPVVLNSAEWAVAGGHMRLSHVSFDFMDRPEERVVEPYVALILGEPVLRIKRDGRWHVQKFRSGQVSIKPPGYRGPFQCSGECETVVVSLDPGVLKHAAAQMELPSDIELVDSIIADSDFLHATLLVLRNEVSAALPGGKMLCESLQTAFCSYLLTHHSSWNRANHVERRRRGGLSQETLKRIEDYIAENLQRDISLTELAQLAFLSNYHFSRLFKKTTDFSPYNYLSNLRVNKAAALIRAGKVEISEIAQVVGFRDHRALYRQFKRILGETPASYIKRIR